MAKLLFNRPRPSRDYAPHRHARSGAATATGSPTGLTRWLLPAALAAALGATALAMPAPARAQDDLVRVLVDVADVILRDGTPWYRHGDYGRYDRLVVAYDRYGRPHYYRDLPRDYRHRDERRVDCNRHGKCKVRYSYYDPRYDRDRYDRVRYHREWDDERDWDDDDDRVRRVSYRHQRDRDD